MAPSDLLANYRDEKLSNIPPSNIANYVKINGWVKVDDAPYNINLYRHSKYNVDIVIPKTQENFDYINDLLKIVKKLSKIENRTPKEIIDDIINNSPSDIIRIRYVSDKDENGTISVNDCINLYMGIRDSINIIEKEILDQDLDEKNEVSSTLKI